MTAPVLYEHDGHVVTLMLNRPEVCNAISDMDMVDALVGVAARINADNEVY